MEKEIWKPIKGLPFTVIATFLRGESGYKSVTFRPKSYISGVTDVYQESCFEKE